MAKEHDYKEYRGKNYTYHYQPHGLEMLAYVRDGLGLKFKIVGILHAGTYDPHDFLTQKGMASWGRPLE